MLVIIHRYFVVIKWRKSGTFGWLAKLSCKKITPLTTDLKQDAYLGSRVGVGVEKGHLEVGTWEWKTERSDDRDSKQHRENNLGVTMAFNGMHFTMEQIARQRCCTSQPWRWVVMWTLIFASWWGVKKLPRTFFIYLSSFITFHLGRFCSVPGSLGNNPILDFAACFGICLFVWCQWKSLIIFALKHTYLVYFLLFFCINLFTRCPLFLVTLKIKPKYTHGLWVVIYLDLPNREKSYGFIPLPGYAHP